MAITFELYEALKSIGVDEEKAKLTAEKFETALEKRLENELKDLSTKEDISNIRIDMANMETRIIKWNVGTIIAAVGITVAIVKLIG